MSSFPLFEEGSLDLNNLKIQGKVTGYFLQSQANFIWTGRNIGVYLTDFLLLIIDSFG